MKYGTLIILLAFGCVSVNATECIQITSRTAPCPNVKYKGVLNVKTQQNELKCFCMTDIESIFAKDISETQRALNSMELQSILVKHQISRAELTTWLKEELQNHK